MQIKYLSSYKNDDKDYNVSLLSPIWTSNLIIKLLGGTENRNSTSAAYPFDLRGWVILYVAIHLPQLHNLPYLIVMAFCFEECNKHRFPLKTTFNLLCFALLLNRWKDGYFHVELLHHY